MTQGNLLSASECALHDAADRQTTQVVGSVQIGDEGLERSVRIPGRARDRVDDGVEQRAEIGVLVGDADTRHRPPLAGHTRDDRELNVLV